MDEKDLKVALEHDEARRASLGMRNPPADLASCDKHQAALASMVAAELLAYAHRLAQTVQQENDLDKARQHLRLIRVVLERAESADRIADRCGARIPVETGGSV